jgi:hypothetical protein
VLTGAFMLAGHRGGGGGEEEDVEEEEEEEGYPAYTRSPEPRLC